MSPQRYRALLSYLPGMAVVVNSFQSPDVQRQVYNDLMKALDVKLDQEGNGTDSRGASKSPSPNGAHGEVAHDLIEGGSIHADMLRS